MICSSTMFIDNQKTYFFLAANDYKLELINKKEYYCSEKYMYYGNKPSN